MPPRLALPFDCLALRLSRASIASPSFAYRLDTPSQYPRLSAPQYAFSPRLSRAVTVSNSFACRLDTPSQYSRLSALEHAPYRRRRTLQEPWLASFKLLDVFLLLCITFVIDHDSPRFNSHNRYPLTLSLPHPDSSSFATDSHFSPLDSPSDLPTVIPCTLLCYSDRQNSAPPFRRRPSSPVLCISYRFPCPTAPPLAHSFSVVFSVCFALSFSPCRCTCAPSIRSFVIPLPLTASFYARRSMFNFVHFPAVASP